MSNEQILSNIYYDWERGYGSAKSPFEPAKRRRRRYYIRRSQEFYEETAKSLIKGYQNYNSYLVPNARAEFQIDIVDTIKFKQEEEEHDAFVVIDAFNRYAYIHPMRNKNSEDALKAWKATFKVMGDPILS